MNTKLPIHVDLYTNQLPRWPQSGQHIVAQFDGTTIIVYQAYNDTIADYAVKHGRFGAGFSFDRMSWIKPNFLWMMFRCGWSQKPDQTRTLAIRLPRAFFDRILSLAVHSSFQPSLYESHDEWKQMVASSDVRLQWDPDHNPYGEKEARRAIQLGLRGSVLREYAHEAIVEVVDLTGFVAEQFACVDQRALDRLLLPVERVYEVSELTKMRIGAD